MALARHKSRGIGAPSIPRACEVCREGPVRSRVADFIFACDQCAKRITTALSHYKKRHHANHNEERSNWEKEKSMSNSSAKGSAHITGASRGVGAVYTDRLAKRDYDLILVGRSARSSRN
jgi:ribosomal protein L37AE/L43A